MAQAVHSNSTRKAAGHAADAVAGRLGKVAVENAANDAVMAEEHLTAALPSANPSALERADSSHAAMAGWMAAPIAGAIATAGRFIGRIGDRLPDWAGRPFKAVRTGLGMPSDVLQSPVVHVRSQVAHGKIWSTHLSGADLTHRQGISALKKVEKTLGGGWFSGIRGTKVKELTTLSKEVEDLKKQFGGLSQDNFDAKNAEAKRLSPKEFIGNVQAFDEKAAWKRFDDAAAALKPKLEGNPTALRQLEKARSQFDAFTTKVTALKQQVTAAEPLVESAAAKAAGLAQRETAASGKAVAYTSGKLTSFGNWLESLAPVRWARDRLVAFHGARAQANEAKGFALQERAAGHLKAAQTAAQGEHLEALDKALNHHASDAAASVHEKLAREMEKAASLPAGMARKEAQRGIMEKRLEQLHEAPVRDAATAIRKKLADEKAALKALPAGDARKAALESFAKKEQTVLGALKKAEKSMGEYSKATLKAHDKFVVATAKRAGAEGIRDLGSKMGALPGAIAKMPAHELLLHGLYGLSQGTSVYRLKKSFSDPMQSLEHMYESVTGKQASAKQILAGELPESMQQAKPQYWRTAAPGALANVAAVVMNHKFMRPGNFAGIKAIPAMMAIQAGASLVQWGFAPKNDLIATYNKIAKDQHAGKEVPKVAIAALLVAAKPDLGKLEMTDKRLLTVAQKYVDEHLTAGQVLRTIDTGEFAKNFAAASKTVEATAKDAAHPAEKTLDEIKPAPENAANTANESFAKLKPQEQEARVADAVSSGAVASLDARRASATEAKPVVGPFSAKLAGENRDTQISATANQSHVDAALQKGEPAVAAR